MTEILLELIKAFVDEPAYLLTLSVVAMFLIYIVRRDKEWMELVKQNTAAFSRFEQVMEKWDTHDDN